MRLAVAICFLLAAVPAARRRRRRHAPARRPRAQRRPHRLRLRQRPLGRRPRRQRRPPPDRRIRASSRARASRPTGSAIAFTGRYEGNVDVYVVPVEGGVPRRLTWHPGATPSAASRPTARPCSSPRRARSTPAATRSSSPCRSRAACPTRLPSRTRARPRSRPTARRSPTCRSASRSRSGRTTAAARPRASALRRRRRTPSSRSRSPRAAATTPTRCGSAARVYFRSDRDGEFNLFAYDPATQGGRRASPQHDDFPVLNASAGGGPVVYEQAGYLHLFDPADGQPRSG